MANNEQRQVRQQQQQKVKDRMADCWRQYCSSRQAILDVAFAARHRTNKISNLEMKLDKLEEVLTPDGKSIEAGVTPPPLTGGKRGRDAEEETDPKMNAGMDPLIVVAEQFADELDSLRKEDQFRGSVRGVEAMADMIRCLALGMNDTERLLLVENPHTEKGLSR